MWPALFIVPWLYYWLRGGWFARILAMFFWVPTVIFMAKKPLDHIPAQEVWQIPLGLLTLASAVVIAWLISSIPAYVKARKIAGSERSLALR